MYTGKFHPSGDILASSGFDRQIFLWKVYGEKQYFIQLLESPIPAVTLQKAPSGDILGVMRDIIDLLMSKRPGKSSK